LSVPVGERRDRCCPFECDDAVEQVFARHFDGGVLTLLGDPEFECEGGRFVVKHTHLSGETRTATGDPILVRSR